MIRRIILVLLIVTVFISATALAEFDLSTLSYDELIQLHMNVMAAIAGSDETVGFTVDGGVYTAGVDFPVGKYCIEALEGSYANYDIYDENNRKVLGGVIDYDDNEKIGSIEMLEGYTFKSDKGAHFGPPAGIVFD